jgi:signal transduction histidine kinase/CheY-like chemotaxis protein/HPt (histidine-containing phosphotransfer) domain-containing protein
MVPPFNQVKTRDTAIAEAVVRRARSGIVMYCLLSGAVLALPPLEHRLTFVLPVLLAAVVLQGATLYRLRHGVEGCEACYRALLASFLLSGAVWGGVCGVALAEGVGPDALALLVLLVAASHNAVIGLVSTLPVMRAYLFVLSAPVVAAALLRPGPRELAEGAVAATVAILLAVQGRTANRDFMASLDRTELNASRSRELQEERARAQAAQADAESARAAADAASRAKSGFLANMSHELRTPLTAIMGYAELLLSPATTDAERIANAETIRRNGEHLLGVLNDILDLSKIEAGKMTVEATLCDLPGLLLDVASLMRVRAVERGLDFELALDSPVPERVVSDELRLRQILLNLVGNAVKFTPKGGIKIRARVEPAGPTLVVDVVDTGIGLKPEQLDHLFLPFSQVDASATRRFQGTGLGLDLSRRLARMMGGDVHVRSEAGRGSTFSLTLPAGDAGAAPMCSSLLSRRRTSTFDLSHEKALTGIRVLLAEDSADLRGLVSAVLRLAGATVETAVDGLDALSKAGLAQAAGAPYHVVLMDMQMPRLDGYGATARLRASGYRWPIAALTAHAMAGERARCLAAGCDDHLTKPIHIPTVLTQVARLARRGPASLGSILPAAPVRGAEPSLTMPETNAADEAPVPGAKADGKAADANAKGDEPLIVSSLGDDTVIASLLGDFYDALAKRSTEVRTRLAAGDFYAAAEAAHQLVGSGGTFGFPNLSAAARAFERSVREGEGTFDEAPRRLGEELLTLCRRVLAGQPTGASNAAA